MNPHGVIPHLTPPDATQASAFSPRRPARILWALLLASLLVLIAARLAGPSALQRFDQPKTTAYTASMVLHHQWLLPDDMEGLLATKPPLVNWMAAPLVAAGFWAEWAVKLPMLLGSVVTLLIVVALGRHLLARIPETAPWAAEGGLLAGIAWLTTPASAEAIYHCRPDPVLVTFLTAAWALATVAMEGTARRPHLTAAGLWVCVGLAGLTKGPPALLPILYIPLAARFIHGPGSARRTGWKWGIPLALGIVGLWLVPVAFLHSRHFFDVLLGHEMFSRMAGVGNRFGNAERGGGTLALLTGFYRNPVWLIQKMLPWSLAALAALWMIKPRQWFRHPLAPAILWMALILMFFSFTAGKTADYILPAYPAVAVLAAWFCVTASMRWRLNPALFGVAGLLVAIALGVQALKFSGAARDRLGENTKAFARAVDAKTGNEPIAFVKTGYNTLEFFLRRHQSGDPAPEALDTSSWLILPLRDGFAAELASKPLPGVGAGGKPGRLGLYRADDRIRDDARRLLRTGK